ncbi:unnamed protein product [Lactuca saligna]|uniref:Myb/SANT-like domain-containing protein n=1 Tax=Lactuca saligna TaxID=75948 RepID=A0AA36DWK5_LACSI|nr:unnamed protein product [Lactuca saligna]
MGGKQHWSNQQLKCLLETCIEEVNKVGRKGLSLHKDSWNKLRSVLKEKYGMDLTHKQMKNAYDNLKAKYRGWVYLRNKTGNIYNPQTNTFTLTTEEWEEFKKGHPKAASLKTHPLPYPDLCVTLFGPSSFHRVQTLDIAYKPNYDLEDDDDIFCETSDPSADSPLCVAPDAAPNTSSKVDRPPCASADSPLSVSLDPTPDTSSKVDRPSKRAKTSNSSINLDDLALDMEKALRHLVKGKDGPTVEECYDRLKLVELDPLDPLFLAAFYIFGVSINMREAWMTLPAIPQVLKGWIKMTATGLGVFK